MLAVIFASYQAGLGQQHLGAVWNLSGPCLAEVRRAGAHPLGKGQGLPAAQGPFLLAEVHTQLFRAWCLRCAAASEPAVRPEGPVRALRVPSLLPASGGAAWQDGGGAGHAVPCRGGGLSRPP